MQRVTRIQITAFREEMVLFNIHCLINALTTANEPLRYSINVCTNREFSFALASVHDIIYENKIIHVSYINKSASVTIHAVQPHTDDEKGHLSQ